MHVLVFSWFFPPYLSAGASRLGQLSKYLTRSGLRVSVVTGRPVDLPQMSDIAHGAQVVYADHLELNALPQMLLGQRSVLEHGYEMSKLGRFRALGMTYKQLVHFPDPQAGWILPALRAASSLDIPDVVFSSSPPASSHVAAAAFALRRGIPWIAEYRSPWTDSLYFRRWWPARHLERALERAIGRRASAVTAISRGLRDTIAGTLGRSVEEIPNGFDPDDYAGVVAPHQGTIVHLGSVYAPYPTRTLLDALPLVQRPIRVVFLGRNLANLPAQLVGSPAERSVERPGPVRRSDAIAAIRGAEANLLFLTEGLRSAQYTDVPQKLYEYFAAGRAIIAVGPTSSETAEVAVSSGLATFVETPAGLAAALERVPAAAPDERVVARYAYERIADRFAELFRAVA